MRSLHQSWKAEKAALVLIAAVQTTAVLHRNNPIRKTAEFTSLFSFTLKRCYEQNLTGTVAV
jgi:hypothetical protein